MHFDASGMNWRFCRKQFLAEVQELANESVTIFVRPNQNIFDSIVAKMRHLAVM